MVRISFLFSPDSSFQKEEPLSILLPLQTKYEQILAIINHYQEFNDPDNDAIRISLIDGETKIILERDDSLQSVLERVNSKEIVVGESVISLWCQKVIPPQRESILEPDWIRASCIGDSFIASASYDRSIRIYGFASTALDGSVSGPFSLSSSQPNSSTKTSATKTSETPATRSIIHHLKDISSDPIVEVLFRKTLFASSSSGIIREYECLTFKPTALYFPPQPVSEEDEMLEVETMDINSESIVQGCSDGSIIVYDRKDVSSAVREDPHISWRRKRINLGFKKKKRSVSSIVKEKKEEEEDLKIELPYYKGRRVMVGKAKISKVQLLEGSKGRLIISFLNGEIIEYDIVRLTVIRKIKMAFGISSFIFATPSLIICTHTNGSIRILEDFTTIRNLSFLHRGWITGIVSCSKGSAAAGGGCGKKYITSGHDGQLVLFSLSLNMDKIIEKEVLGEFGKILTLSEGHNGKLFCCGGEDCKLMIWNK